MWVKMPRIDSIFGILYEHEGIGFPGYIPNLTENFICSFREGHLACETYKSDRRAQVCLACVVWADKEI